MPRHRCFRDALKRRRCLVPADAFYQWKKIDAKTKQPHAIALKSDSLFAGLWDTWRDKATGETRERNAPRVAIAPSIKPCQNWLESMFFDSYFPLSQQGWLLLARRALALGEFAMRITLMPFLCRHKLIRHMCRRDGLVALCAN